jgi:methionyl-tRNA formyltransferase
LCGYPDSDYARNLLIALNANGIRGVNIIAVDDPASSRSLGVLWTKHGLAVAWLGAKWLLKRGMSILAFFRDSQKNRTVTLEMATIAQGGAFITVPEINGEVCCTALRRLNVDLAILAGTPIVRKNVLSVPKVGTLNAHQGALPRFRGMNVIEWAVFENESPTITVHFVDPGVDTGDIVGEEQVPICPGDTLQRIRERASTQQIDLLTRMIVGANGGALPRRCQKLQSGRQYFTMHPMLRRIAESRLQAQIQTQRVSSHKSADYAEH